MSRGNPQALAEYRAGKLRQKEAEWTRKHWLCTYCDLFFSRAEAEDTDSEKPVCPHCGWRNHVERKDG